MRSRLLFALCFVGCAHRQPRLPEGNATLETKAQPVSLVRDAHAGGPVVQEPADGATVETKRPRFAWTLPEGADGAVVEICRNVYFKAIEDTIVGVDAGVATHDLPTVPLFYRVTATTHGVRGPSSAPRAFDVHVTTTLSGKHVDVTVPYDAVPLGRRLVELSDHAFESYATWLGVPPPSNRCSVELLLPNPYLRESKKRILLYATSGFTRFGPDEKSESFVSFDLGSARSTEELPGQLEWATLHELEHCAMHFVRHTTAPLRSWLSEGAAELFAERALAEAFAIPRTRLLVAAARARATRRIATLQKSKWMHLRALFDIGQLGLSFSDNGRAAVVYAESASLLHFLDTSPRYRDRFAAFLRTLVTVQKPAFFEDRLGASFESIVGDLDSVEADFRDSLPKEDLFPYSAMLGELRPYGSAGIVIDSAMVGQATRVSVDGEHDEAHVGDTLELELTPRPGDSKRVLIVFGLRNLGFYRIGLKEGAAPTIDVLKLSSGEEPKPEPIASHPVKMGALSAGATTKLRVLLKSTEVEVVLDGESILRCALPEGATTGGWGMGAVGGPARFTKAARLRAP